MSFDYILSLIKTTGLPPSGANLHIRKDCFFAPICHEKSIYTIDVMLWGAGKNQNFDIEELLLPFKYYVEDFFQKEESLNNITICALTAHKQLKPIHSKVFLELQAMKHRKDFMEIGFDVIDFSLGISTLTNIGYNQKEVEMLRQFKINTNTNQYGLIEKMEDAYIFSHFASNIAKEHAPFILAKVLLKKGLS